MRNPPMKRNKFKTQVHQEFMGLSMSGAMGTRGGGGIGESVCAHPSACMCVCE
jgi:hypothetical protein